MAIPATDTRVYGDLAGLEALKGSARNKNPSAVREVARQFESLFARMMLKSMRDAIGRDPIFGSDQQQMYQGMFDDQLSIELTKGHGLGLADMLVRQLQHAAGPAQGAAPGTPARAGAPGTASSAEREKFVSELWPQAQEAGKELGVHPANLIAQAALESNWGRSLPRDANGRSSNNLFGVKAGGRWSGPTVSATTSEFQNGVSTATSATFRAYPSPSQSFQDYVAVLQSEPRYAAALHTGSDVRSFATALQRAGYATDPDYRNKLTQILNSGALQAALLPRTAAL
jgi:peptidoglycan hydrolase FlgJ